jgi:hypothetical protein
LYGIHVWITIHEHHKKKVDTKGVVIKGVYCIGEGLLPTASLTFSVRASRVVASWLMDNSIITPLICSEVEIQDNWLLQVDNWKIINLWTLNPSNPSLPSWLGVSSFGQNKACMPLWENFIPTQPPDYLCHHALNAKHHVVVQEFWTQCVVGG